MVDYQNLCIRLFGTDDVEKLEKIAVQITRKNVRNAGRKRKYSEKEIQEITRLISAGESINTVAKKFGTSRQVISKYINPKPAQNYTMRMTYMYKHRPCTVIDIDFLDEKIKIQNRTDDLLHRAFGVTENPTWRDFERFLRDRCFPETCGNAKTILNQLHLTDYDPLQIIERTKGRTAEDAMWLKIDYRTRREAVQ